MMYGNRLYVFFRPFSECFRNGAFLINNLLINSARGNSEKGVSDDVDETTAGLGKRSITLAGETAFVSVIA